MLKSFSRRLGYLHESQEAVEISTRWLSKNGLLENIINLNELGISLLNNIAPLNPELILISIENASRQDDSQLF